MKLVETATVVVAAKLRVGQTAISSRVKSLGMVGVTGPGSECGQA